MLKIDLMVLTNALSIKQGGKITLASYSDAYYENSNSFGFK